MNVILADKLFADKRLLNSIHIGEENALTLDFKYVKDFNLNNIYALLDLHKIALFNNVELNIKNTTPNIDKILYETGIYKTLKGFSTNPILASKRLNFS